MLGKNKKHKGNQWVRDKENMVDVAKSHIPSQWVSEVVILAICGQGLSSSKIGPHR